MAAPALLSSPALGPVLGFAGDVLGALGGRSSARASKNMAAAQMWAQEQYAKKGIQWRVADAKAAGLHPLFALGATGASYSPQAFIPGQSPTGSHAGAALQGLGRAVQQYQAQKMDYDLRREALSLERERLALREDKKKAVLTDKVVSTPGTIIKPTERSSTGPRALGAAGGRRWDMRPGRSPMQDWEDEYGDLVSSFLGGIAALDDALYNYGPVNPSPTLVDPKRRLKRVYGRRPARTVQPSRRAKRLKGAPRWRDLF